MNDDAIACCREWLGIDPGDLSFPHRVLGVDAEERDPLAIVRAADRRLATLRAVVGAPDAELASCSAAVEAARDSMLAAAVATRAPAVPPPLAPPPVPPPVPADQRPAATPVPQVMWQAPPSPMPPPVPPPVPPAEAPTADNPFAASPLPSRGRRPPASRRQDSAATALGVSALVLTAGALAVYVAWPQLARSRASLAGRDTARRSAEPRPTPAPEPEPTPPPKPALKPAPGPERTREPRPKTKPKPEPPSQPAAMPQPRSEPATDPAPVPEPAPPPPTVDVDAVRAEVGTAITQAFAAIRGQDFAAAKRTLDAILSRALDDQEATDRVQRWQQFVTYAQAYPGYRDKALASAASTTATYDLGDRHVGVVEVTNDEFIYRDSRRPGRNLHAPRDAIPPEIEQGLVRAWFAADGRAANHLFLGAAALARREPDLGAARREWETAAAGGEPDGRLLLGILDDPAVRGR